MKRSRQLPAIVLMAACFLLGGCSSCEMKGTPFYSGEYKINVPGAETRRVNLWPITYYREPALSMLWPLFEHTDEHVALRPFFSAYGGTNGYWEYNVLWPFCQADKKNHDYRVFPYFWGQNQREGKIGQDYHVLFPFVWHYEDETRALFPLWISDAGGWKEGRFTEHDTWFGWPLCHRHTGDTQNGWRVATFGRYSYQHPDRRETYTGYPWPFFFSWRDKETHGLFTPLYAYGMTNKEGVRDGWAALPFLLSWHRWQNDASDLNALFGLYNQSWSGDNRSGYLLPLCAYDKKDGLFLTPLFGWDKPDPKNPDGYLYPLTPLAGSLTGAHRGGWLFPLFHHSANITNDTFSTRALLLAYNERSRHAWKEGASEDESYGVFPLFSHTLHASNTRNATSGSTRAETNQWDRQLLVSYSHSRHTTCQSLPHATASEPRDPQSQPPEEASLRSTSHGLFPFWSHKTSLRTRLDGSPIDAQEESALLLAVFDTRHETEAAKGGKSAQDYRRRRILWRLWHYEKRNGNVSVDIFPGITYDTRADGFSKTSFLWRFYRYERHPEGGVDLDLLFLPLSRAR